MESRDDLAPYEIVWQCLSPSQQRAAKRVLGHEVQSAIQNDPLVYCALRNVAILRLFTMRDDMTLYQRALEIGSLFDLSPERIRDIVRELRG